MEQTPSLLTSKIRKNSFYHLCICAITAVSSILFTIFLSYLPLAITLAVTSIITLISGITGYKIDTQTSKTQILRHFIIEILLLAAWDFGGVVCIVTIITALKSSKTLKKALIIVLCCLVYIGIFVFFWRTFMVVNKLVTLLNKRRLSFNPNLTSTKVQNTHIKNPQAISMSQNILQNTPEHRKLSINTSSLQLNI
jgi:glucan phosphoethanolaminetransferase (alkaline phosphatase superfamily)